MATSTPSVAIISIASAASATITSSSSRTFPRTFDSTQFNYCQFFADVLKTLPDASAQ